MLLSQNKFKSFLAVFFFSITNMMAIPSLNVLCKEAFERYPFGIIFSKTAPANLSAVNFDTDFCYFYFSPGLEQRSPLNRASMCNGKINAKRDFPDYKAYFEDDINVMRTYTDGKVLAFCEPWSPPGISSYIYTRKTALQSEDQSFMLGCFDLVDDITLGIAKFKRVAHDATSSLSSMGSIQIADQWFGDAFDALPNGLAIIRNDNTVVFSNKQWKEASIPNDENGQFFTEESFIKRIKKLFAEHGFDSKAQVLLSSAAWLTGSIKHNSGHYYDVGTYGVKFGDEVFQVFVLRPAMIEVAKPCWLALCIS